jgi:lipoate-protein ligase A
VLFKNLRVIKDPVARTAAFNMAFDECLLETIAEPTLRLYRWESDAISFGYFIRYEVVAAAFPGRELVRRMTGGGIVDHSADLTYSLIIPSGHALSEAPPRESYRAIHAAIADWLATRGKASVLSPTPLTKPANVCFEAPAEFDLMDAGRKIAGAAQRRTRSGLLHQGTVQMPDVDSLRDEFPNAFSEQLTMIVPGEELIEATKKLAAQKYAQPAWLKRV